MQKIEFKKPKGELWSRPVEEEVNEFVQIATFLTKSLGWKVTTKYDECEFEMAYWFQKYDTVITLYYDTMDGMSLSTQDDTFALEALFDEINNFLRKTIQ